MSFLNVLAASFRRNNTFKLSLKKQKSIAGGLPCLVERCLQFLESEGKHTKGLFLTNGNTQNMRRVRQLLKGDADADLFKLKAKFPQITPHDVATVLYDFLRNVPGEAIINKDCAMPLYESMGSPEISRDINMKRTIRSLMTPVQALLLRRLCSFLNSVHQRGESLDDLSIKFAPVLFRRTKRNAVPAVLWNHTTVQITALLIRSANTFFKELIRPNTFRWTGRSGRKEMSAASASSMSASSISILTQKTMSAAPASSASIRKQKSAIPAHMKKSSRYRSESGQLLFQRGLDFMDSPDRVRPKEIPAARRRKGSVPVPPSYISSLRRRKMSAPPRSPRLSADMSPEPFSPTTNIITNISPHISPPRSRRSASYSGHRIFQLASPAMSSTSPTHNRLKRVASKEKLKRPPLSTHRPPLPPTHRPPLAKSRHIRRTSSAVAAAASAQRLKSPAPGKLKHKLMLVRVTIQAFLKNTGKNKHGHGRKWLKTLQPLMTSEPKLVEYLQTNGRALVNALNRTSMDLRLQGILLDEHGSELDVDALMEGTLKEMAEASV